MRKRMFLLFILTGMIWMLGSPVHAAADEKQNEQPTNPMGFVYSLEMPENQLSDASYFDLQLKTGEKQTLRVKLTNLLSKEIAVNVRVNTAKTNSNGVIEYGPNKLKSDPDIPFDFVDYVQAPSSIKLAANSSQYLELNVNMPKKAFSGILLGGVQLQRAEKEAETQEDSVSLTNKYAYVFSIALRENEQEIAPDLAMSGIQVKSVENSSKNLYADLVNVTPVVIRDVTVEAVITPQDSQRVLHEIKRTDLKLAPHSIMNLPMYDVSTELKAGKYKAYLTAKSGDKEWKWEEAFAITQKDLEEKQPTPSELNNSWSWWKLVGLALLIVGLIGLVFFCLRKYSRKKSNLRRPDKKN